jgi:hypothetical protein
LKKVYILTTFAKGICTLENKKWRKTHKLFVVILIEKKSRERRR